MPYMRSILAMRMPKTPMHGFIDYVYYHTECDYFDVIRDAMTIAGSPTVGWEDLYASLDQHLQKIENRSLTQEDKDQIQILAEKYVKDQKSEDRSRIFGGLLLTFGIGIAMVGLLFLVIVLEATKNGQTIIF